MQHYPSHGHTDDIPHGDGNVVGIELEAVLYNVSAWAGSNSRTETPSKHTAPTATEWVWIAAVVVDEAVVELLLVLVAADWAVTAAAATSDALTTKKRSNMLSVVVRRPVN